MVTIDLAPDDRMHDDPGRNSVAVKMSARVTTRLLSTKYASALPMIGLTEFPKSGGTWVGQVLSTYLGVPFPQRPRLPVLMRSIWHGHWTPPKRADVLVVRDPRDCYVSLFHQRIAMATSATGRERAGGRNQRLRELFSIAVSTGEAQPGDVDRYFEYLLEGNRLGEPDWIGFHRAWLDAGAPVTINYADARTDPHDAFGRLIRALFGSVDERRLDASINRYDFAVVAGSGGFVRRGVASDGWRSEVSESVASRLDGAFPRSMLDELAAGAE